MVDYTISFTGATCIISDLKLHKEKPFLLPKLPHNDSITCLTIKNSTIPCLTEDIIGSFVNLKRIDATSNGIEEVSEDAFVDCKSLKHIDLSKNSIKELEMNTFNRNPNLTIINLEENRLESLPEELFLDLEELHTLNLSSNCLTSLSKKIFKHLKNLMFVNLNHNQLLDLKPEEVIEQLPKLEGFGLRDNDFSASKLNQILKGFNDAKIKCNLSPIGKMRQRSYRIQINTDGFEYIPDVEYDRLVAKRKISKLEQKLEAMHKKVQLMQGSISFLLKEHEIEMNKKKNHATPTYMPMRAEDLERDFKQFYIEQQEAKAKSNIN